MAQDQNTPQPDHDQPPVTHDDVTPTDPVEPAPEATEDDQGATPPDVAEVIENDVRIKKANAEAAKYRTRVRELETENQQLKDAARAKTREAMDEKIGATTTLKMSLHQTDQANKLIGPITGHVDLGYPEGIADDEIDEHTPRWGVPIKLRHPDDFYLMTGLTDDDLMTDTGQFNEAKYGKEIEKLFAKRPELFELGNPAPDNNAGLAEAFGKMPVSVTRGNDWENAFGPQGN